MNDVAAAAGVSQATVSLVLNDVENSGISQATMVRVLTVARQMGYRQNAVARSLKLQRSDTIGFVSDEITASPYAFGLVQGAEDACRQAGKQLLISNVSHVTDISRDAAEEQAIARLLERRVDGIIFAAVSQRVVEVPPILREAPSVLVDLRPIDDSLPSIVPDERSAATELCDVLLDAGHEHLVHLTPKENSTTAVLRRDGFVEALTRRGIEITDDVLVATEDSTAGAFQTALGVLARPMRPTAFSCYSDEIAWGVYQAAASLGLLVPEDLSVVGFKNVALIAPALRPGLTTVSLPHRVMAEWAVSYLVSGRTDLVQESISCPLVVRASVSEPS